MNKITTPFCNPLFLLLLLGLLRSASLAAQSTTALKEGFTHPSESAKPWTWTALYKEGDSLLSSGLLGQVSIIPTQRISLKS